MPLNVSFYDMAKCAALQGLISDSVFVVFFLFWGIVLIFSVV